MAAVTFAGGSGDRGGLMRTQAHCGFDIGDFQPSLVIAHRRVLSGEIHGHAFDTWHFSDPLLHLSYAEHGQHGVYFDNACFHIESFVGFMREGLPVL